MKCILFPLLCFPFLLSGQPLRLNNLPETPSNTSTIYAVVVGISNYTDEAVKDLRYADKDAIAFDNFLRSPAGGALNSSQIKLLLNSDATQHQFVMALDWLKEVTKEGDKAIIYFSGHGDVEKRVLEPDGFLLCSDVNAGIYTAGGAVSLDVLQKAISWLSLTNKAKVVVITDACRSGALAGKSVTGSQDIATYLARQYTNEIKILSCHPNESSHEGEQWGGGRGAFSFNLVDALYGMADEDNDGFVTLQEVKFYLEDHVVEEVAPQQQEPIVFGNRNERLSTIDQALLNDLRHRKANQMAMLSPGASKSFDDDLLQGLDTSVLDLYRLFQQALKDKVFFSPAGTCADAYYLQLIQEHTLDTLYTTMRRDYAAALLDDAQLVINKWLKTDVLELTLSKNTQAEKYKAYPAYLQRAIDLLGPGHYMYSGLQANKLFFEGYLLYLTLQGRDSIQGSKALKKFRSALKWNPNLPQVYYSMSKVFWVAMEQPDSAAWYGTYANSLATTWALPFTDISRMYAYKYQQFGLAKSYLDKATKIDSNSIMVLLAWADYYFYQERFKEAEYYYKKCLAIKPDFFWALNNLGVVCTKSKHYKKAIFFYKKILETDPSFTTAYYNIACIHSLQHRLDQAYDYLELALINGFNNFDDLQGDPELAFVRGNSERWRSLMKKHFPDKVKD